MKIIRRLNENPALCSLIVACIGSITALVVAIGGWIWTFNVTQVTLKAEGNRLIEFHKLEIYENAIEEINYLVPLYRKLWTDAYEKRSVMELRPALPTLRKTIDTIVEYQKTHNAIGKAQVYSEALKEYVPFVANPDCIDYIQQLDFIEKNLQDKRKISSLEKEGIQDMYLVDALHEYDNCAEQLKEEIEKLELFKR